MSPRSRGSVEMTTERPTMAATGGSTSAPDPYSIDGSEVARSLGVDPTQGLAAAEAASRLTSYGRNKLAEGKKESGIQAFLRQYADFMQIILLGAAVINALVTDEAGTTILLAGLTVMNAVIGLRQEAKAERSEEHTSELQSLRHLVCRLLLEKKKQRQ